MQYAVCLVPRSLREVDPLYDLSGKKGQSLVRLVDVMPGILDTGQTADAAIVQAARVSYGAGTKKLSEDAALIRYLMRHHHTTPFEMVEFKFHIRAPIFVARQWLRHRTASVNEVSARYSAMPNEYYTPMNGRPQSKANKQGSDEDKLDDYLNWQFQAFMRQGCQQHAQYEELEKAGVSREQARMGLPVNLFTEWYWKIDLHNLLHFLNLRLHPHAQEEIRVYAEAILKMVACVCPQTVDAWEEYRRHSITLSRTDQAALLAALGNPKLDMNEVRKYGNPREVSERIDKFERMGLL